MPYVETCRLFRRLSWLNQVELWFSKTSAM
jgi:hypothetical protein